jgi:hypothetical protein
MASFLLAALALPALPTLAAGSIATTVLITGIGVAVTSRLSARGKA